MTESIGPLNGGEVTLTDLVGDSNIIDGLEATGVTFNGPGIITFLPGDHVIDECEWTFGEAGFESLLVEVPSDRRRVSGVIGLRNANLRGCRFVGVQVAGTAAALHAFSETVTVGPKN